MQVRGERRGAGFCVFRFLTELQRRGAKRHHLPAKERYARAPASVRTERGRERLGAERHCVGVEKRPQPSPRAEAATWSCLRRHVWKEGQTASPEACVLDPKFWKTASAPRLVRGGQLPVRRLAWQTLWARWLGSEGSRVRFWLGAGFLPYFMSLVAATVQLQRLLPGRIQMWPNLSR